MSECDTLQYVNIELSVQRDIAVSPWFRWNQPQKLKVRGSVFDIPKQGKQHYHLATNSFETKNMNGYRI